MHLPSRTAFSYGWFTYQEEGTFTFGSPLFILTSSRSIRSVKSFPHANIRKLWSLSWTIILSSVFGWNLLQWGTLLSLSNVFLQRAHFPLYRACDMLKTTVEVSSPQIPIYWLHCSDFRMHCTNDKVDTFVMLGMMVTSTNVIREVGGSC